MLRPIGDKVLIRRDEVETKTPSGLIYKPEKAQEKPQVGTVIATGAGLIDANGKLHEPRVKRGDKVLFAKYLGTEVDVEGEELIIIKEGDIYGVFGLDDAAN